MDNSVTISLVVSGVGMLMLFLALALLYGLTYLMTALIKDRPGAGGRKQEAGGERQEAGSRKRRAAVIAVALARAEQERVIPPSVPPIGGEERGGGMVSAWRAFHQQRQLTLNLRMRKVR